MDNIEQFSLYTAKILKILYEAFPVPIYIDEKNVISEYLLFDKHEELKELKTKIDIADLIEHTFKEEQKEIVRENVTKFMDEYKKLDSEKNDEFRTQREIYQGTLDFLISENLISKISQGGYRLTSRSFSHLNKQFKDGKVENEDSSYIIAIKNMFSNASSIPKEITVGLALKIIPKLLGI